MVDTLYGKLLVIKQTDTAGNVIERERRTTTNHAMKTCRRAWNIAQRRNPALVPPNNPFARMEPKYTYVVFLDARPPRDALDQAVGVTGEKMALGKREIFIHYPNGMGCSRLRIPAAKAGTARNLNTVAKLAELAAKR